MAGAGWAAAAQAATSLGSSFIANAGAANRQRKADKYNTEFWNMQNAYNHPSAQMARLREAGLNPNLIYGTSGNQSVGNAEKIAPSKAAPFKFDNPLSNITSFADVKQKEAQTDNLRAQNTVLQQERILKAAQTAKLGQETARTTFDLGLATDLRNTSLEAAQANLNSIKQGVIGKQLDNTFKSQSLKKRVEQIYMAVKNAKANLKGTQLSNKLKQEELELRKLGIMNNDPWYFRIFGKDPEVMKSIKSIKN